MAKLRDYLDPWQPAQIEGNGEGVMYQGTPETQAAPAQGPAKTLHPAGGGFNYGWNFGGHENVGSNLNTPKYMLSNYLMQNNIDPNSDWSQGAADYLNGLGVTGVQANGGRRVSFGDEFVDTTKQPGEFFWGSNPGSANGPGGMPGSSNPNMFAPSQFTGSGGGQSGGGGDLSGALSEGILSILKGGFGPDKNQLAKRYESARETIDRGRRSQTASLRAALADRGLMGSGAEITGLGRIEEGLAGDYSTALRDATVTEDKIASDRYMQALQAALGSQANNTEQQKVVGQLAVDNLNQNRMWNQFLAEYGLNREKVMSEIQNGNIGAYTGLINAFMQYGQSQSNGYVGNT